MTALSIQPPYPIFTEADGSPLENGFVYIGTANLDPVANPIAVYWDAALTIPAAQPIRTLNGYPSRNGTPARLYVGSDYSIRVNDAKGVAVYSAPAATERLSEAVIEMVASKVTYTQAGTGASSRTVQNKLREFVSDTDFGAIGDGITNDTIALQNFWNSAIANPGVPHRLRRRRYLVSAAMPTINVSGVIIEGGGAEIHDVGTLVTGTVLVWGGGSAPSTILCSVQPPTGASAQRLAGIVLAGIGIDAVAQLGYGFEIASVQESRFDLTVANASNTGVNLRCVSPLGEAADLQRCNIRVNGRQVEAASGLVLALGGISVTPGPGANVSMNFIEVDCQHKDAPAIYCVNSDNNDWPFVRCFRVPGGTASESVSLLGTNVFGDGARAERFWFFTANTPMHAYGTTGSPTYTFGSTGNQIFSLDKENGTPAPIVEGGAVVNWREEDSALSDNDWIAYTPTITAQTGTLTTVTGVSGAFRKLGKRCEFKLQFTVTTNGTGATALRATLPLFTVAGTIGDMCVGKERAINSRTLSGFMEAGTNFVSLQNFDGTYPGVNGGVYTVSGEYQIIS